jgi:radical SAM protein with 4Fe4S-binding SPASM domain
MDKKPSGSGHMPCLSTPETVYIDITPFCNLRCKHCYSASAARSNQKSFDAVCTLLDELTAAGVLRVAFVGREPLVRTDFPKILAYASRCGIATRLATNGTLVNAAVAKVLAASKIHSVQVSIDSASARRHNWLRGSEKAFDWAVKAIETLVQYDVRVCVSTTLSHYNYLELHDIADLASDLGASHYRARLMIGNRRNNRLQITKEQYKQAVKVLLELRDYYKTMTVEQLHHWFLIDRAVPYCVDRDITIPCGAGLSKCSLTHDFRVTPCIALAHLFSSPIDKGIVEEWRNGKVFGQWRRIYSSLRGKCSVCGYRYLCGGGCRANVYGITGDINSSDPWCWFEPEGRYA